jgi:hypothetical protein
MSRGQGRQGHSEIQPAWRAIRRLPWSFASRTLPICGSATDVRQFAPLETDHRAPSLGETGDFLTAGRTPSLRCAGHCDVAPVSCSKGTEG